MNVLISVFLHFMLVKVTQNQVENLNFICTDGTIIKFQNVCDGFKHCLDGSDETINLCYHLKCPKDTFRCYYGACVSINARCDNKYQCADKSDEYHCNKFSIACKKDEFQCASQTCISKEKVCDGNIDCSDASDEVSGTCELFLCPKNTFHCKYGGCVNLDARCNGFPDCADSSDESEIICNSLNCTKKDCYQSNYKVENFNTTFMKFFSVYKTLLCPPIISMRINKKCTHDVYPPQDWISCNTPVPIGTLVKYECKPYYRPADIKQYQNKQAICQSDGNWNRESLKCEPICGIKQPAAVPLIVNGWDSRNSIWPWHSTLYSYQNGKWRFWCGGSLISEKVVVTAAHCVWKITPATIRIALGKYYKKYTNMEPFTQIYDTAKIIIQPTYQDALGNYGSDIALVVLKGTAQLSLYVSPICLDWNYTFGNELDGRPGIVVGMGVTENNTFSENIRASSLQVVSHVKCIKTQSKDFQKYITYTSFCAGWLNGTGVCNGDSGGGLVFPKLDGTNEWVLQGIVSISPRRLGTFLCNPYRYTLFTKINLYLNWIKQVLKQIHRKDY